MRIAGVKASPSRHINSLSNIGKPQPRLGVTLAAVSYALSQASKARMDLFSEPMQTYRCLAFDTGENPRPPVDLRTLRPETCGALTAGPRPI